MAAWHKSVELIANVAIILVAVLLGVILVNKYLQPADPAQVERRQIKPGTKLALTGVEWSESRRSLLMVLSTSCRYCTESAPFYQRLVAEKAKHPDIDLVAVLPQNPAESQKYLSDLGIAVNAVKHATPASLGVSGTPTLILVDGSGSVINSWMGKLPAAVETEVINTFQE